MFPPKITRLFKYSIFCMGLFTVYFISLQILYAGDSGTNMNKKIACTEEKRHIVFIKCMKCATESMETIFRRFGYIRKLNFVLPRKRNLYLGWPGPMEKMDYRPSKRPFDILTEHAIYNKTFMDDLMPNDTVYISIIREPWSHFKSTFSYFRMASIGELPKVSDQLSEFLSDIEKYERIYSSPKKNFLRWCTPDYFSPTRSMMSHCLGMPLGFPKGRKDIMNNDTAIMEYIQFIEKHFKLVMLVEYFDESLILLKRLMCWSLKDILYQKTNSGNYSYRSYEPTKQQQEIHRNWSRADYMLYEYFNKTFWTKVAAQGPDFIEEVKHFKAVEATIQKFCFGEKRPNLSTDVFIIRKTKFNSEFNVTKEYCELMHFFILPKLWEQYSQMEGLQPDHSLSFKDLLFPNRPEKGCSWTL
ncbi:hypothetical protein ACJMK2_011731 [Sinanodonta woodiana]|uniref:Uncharacterized protein n=1 Tax=Sinanodonta woodiana TaxID=1069815 RepID=A0ABD3V5Z3_SINWO